MADGPPAVEIGKALLGLASVLGVYRFLTGGDKAPELTPEQQQELTRKVNDAVEVLSKYVAKASAEEVRRAVRIELGVYACARACTVQCAGAHVAPRNRNSVGLRVDAWGTSSTYITQINH